MYLRLLLSLLGADMNSLKIVERVGPSPLSSEHRDNPGAAIRSSRIDVSGEREDVKGGGEGLGARNMNAVCLAALR